MADLGLTRLLFAPYNTPTVAGFMVAIPNLPHHNQGSGWVCHKSGFLVIRLIFFEKYETMMSRKVSNVGFTTYTWGGLDAPKTQTHYEPNSN